MRAIARAFVLSGLGAFLSMVPPAFAQTATVPIATVPYPEQLASLDVVDPDGGPVGTVLAVKTDSDGRAHRVMVMLSTSEGQCRLATIRPERLSFDKARRVLVADFAAAQLMQLAATATTPKGGVDIGGSSGLVQRYGGGPHPKRA